MVSIKTYFLLEFFMRYLKVFCLLPLILFPASVQSCSDWTEEEFERLRTRQSQEQQGNILSTGKWGADPALLKITKGKALKKQRGSECGTEPSETSLLLKRLSNEELLHIACCLDVRSLESLKATCRRFYFIASAAEKKPWLVDFYTLFGYRYIVRTELFSLFGPAFTKPIQAFIEQNPEMYEGVFRRILIPETQDLLKNNLPSITSKIQDSIAFFLVMGYRQEFCIGGTFSQRSIVRLVGHFHEKGYTPKEIRGLARVLSENRNRVFGEAVPNNTYFLLVENLAYFKLPPSKIQEFFATLEENARFLFRHISTWERLKLASGLIPFSAEKISVIAQNSHRIFRNIRGHESKNSILRAMLEAELSAPQIIEFAAALERNRERLLPAEMWEDVQLPIIIEMTKYTGRQIDFIARNSSVFLAYPLGVGNMGVYVRSFLINIMSTLSKRLYR